MTDLNTVMRDQARAGLQVQLDKAVTDGETETARKIADDLARLAVSTAPKAPPFGQAEITAELDKQPWFGIDPKKSAKTVELGKTMDPRKFATAAAFADALVKAVDEEFKVPATAADVDPDADPADVDPDADPKPGEKKPRRTDAPSEGEASVRAASRRTAGPWAKLSDAPPDTQREIKRQADKFVSASAPKEQREKFIAKALESHYVQHQRRERNRP